MSAGLSLYASAGEMLAALRGGHISARRLLDLHLERLHALNPALNAVIRTDLRRAREQALELDIMAENGRWAGPLHGLPMTVKDTFDLSTMPATAGVVGYAHRTGEIFDAELVRRLRKAGAIIWGKTNTPPYAVGHHTVNTLYGASRNPFDQTRTPGGSSGGSAAALAAGITPLELGSDIGGSLRVPAHFCGVYALKPGAGLLSMSGHVPPPPGRFVERDMDVAGPMARNIADLRLAMRVLSGSGFADGGDFALIRRKLAIWKAEPGFPLSGACMAAISRIESAADQLGAQTCHTRPDIDGVAMFDIFMRLLLSALASDIHPAARAAMVCLRPLAGLIGWWPGTKWWSRWLLYSTASHSNWLEANEGREQMCREVEQFFHTYAAIIAPVAPIPAFVPRISGQYLGQHFTFDDTHAPHAVFSCWTALASVCRLPALTIPAGRSATGLPIGAQIIGPKGSEELLLDIGEALAEKIGGFAPPGHLISKHGADGGS